MNALVKASETVSPPALMLALLVLVGAPTWALAVMGVFLTIAIVAAISNAFPRRAPARAH